MQNLEQQIEAIIFSSDRPVTINEILDCLTKAHDAFFETTTIEQHLHQLLSKYKAPEYAFTLVETGGGYEFLTKADYHELISVFLNQKSKKRLSTAAMETLAIIAYKQPITKTEVEQIRGVNCDYTISKLLEKDLITMVGREEGPGRPVLYATSETFMDYFGINSVHDLPKPKDIAAKEENEIGDREDIIEYP